MTDKPLFSEMTSEQRERAATGMAVALPDGYDRVCILIDGRGPSIIAVGAEVPAMRYQTNSDGQSVWARAFPAPLDS